MDEAALDRYAEAAWNLRCERGAEAKERPSGITSWEDRAPFLREIDRSAASLVAAMAVADAGLEDKRRGGQLFALSVHLPAIRRALVVAVGEATYEAEARPYRAALQALGGSEGDDGGH